MSVRRSTRPRPSSSSSFASVPAFPSALASAMTSPSANPLSVPLVLRHNSVDAWLADDTTHEAFEGLENMLLLPNVAEPRLDYAYLPIYHSIARKAARGGQQRVTIAPQPELSKLGDGGWNSSVSMALYWQEVQRRAGSAVASAPSTSSRTSRGVNKADFAIFATFNQAMRVTGIGEFKIPAFSKEETVTSRWGASIPTVSGRKENHDKCKHGLAQAVWYLHGSNEVDGNVLGILIFGSSFRRILVHEDEGGVSGKTFLVEVVSSAGLDLIGAPITHSFGDFFSASAVPEKERLLFDPKLVPNDILSPLEEEGRMAAVRLYRWYWDAIQLANTIPVDVERPVQNPTSHADKDQEGPFAKVVASTGDLVQVAMDTDTAANNIRTAKEAMKARAKQGQSSAGAADPRGDGSGGGNGGAGGSGSGSQGMGAGNQATSSTHGPYSRRPQSTSRSSDKGKGKETVRAFGPATDSVLSWRETVVNQQSGTVPEGVMPVTPVPGQKKEDETGEQGEQEGEEEQGDVGSDLEKDMALRVVDSEDQGDLDVDVMMWVMDKLGIRMQLVEAGEMDRMLEVARQSGRTGREE